MSRSVPWRRTCPDKVSSRIDRASRARIYLLRATGPTGFLLTAEGDDRKFKVFLGDPHSCTCPTFVREKDLCIHILWVLIKKFRVPKDNSVVYQLGLVEREIGEVVRGLFTNTEQNKPAARKTDGESDSREKLSKKEVTEDDVCPICQEDLFGQTQPTTYCKYGCGNSVHVKCMKVWAEHQKSSGETIVKCPLCRVDFGPFETIKTEYLRSVKKQRFDVHVGAVCAHCGMSPITGRCYRCTICSNFQLCKDCFSLDPHPEHSFHCRQRSNQRWRPASRIHVIPSAVANDLETRDITEQDYNLLLQLDGSSMGQCSVPGHVLNSFPTERLADDNHRLVVNTNEKCAVCLCSYSPSQVVRRLPCNHEFHRVCIDSWLSSDHNTCPVDGQMIYSEFARTNFSQNRGRNRGTQRPPQRNIPVKKTSFSTLIKRQRTSHNTGPTIPQDFFLNGSSFRQRNVIASPEVPVESTNRTNSAPAPTAQILLPLESSSRHIVFDTSLLGRPVVSAERVIRYGRHSGDSRLRALQKSERNKNKNIGPKSISLNDITLSGQKISTTELNHGPMLNTNNGPTPNLVQSPPSGNDPTLLHTTIVTSSPDPNHSHVRVDV